MPIPIYRPCNTNSSFTPSAPFTNPIITTAIFPLAKSPKPRSGSCKSLCFSFKLPKFRRTRVPLCAKNGVFEESKDTLLPKRPENEEAEELELLNKPSPKQVSNGALEEIEENELKTLDKDEILEPFYKFFRPFEEESDSEGGNLRSAEEENEKISVEYYEPKPGDLVVGVVVSGNENKLDVNVGADLLGTMLTKEVLPLYDKEMDYLLCDVEKDADEFLVRGKVGIVSNDEAISGEPMPGKPVVEPGTVLFAEVLGRTLGGRPLLSTRRLFRRIAWHRVRQVGRRIHVQITRINEDTNDLILSEKEAWEMMHLQEGTLLEGTVKRIFPYGAQIRIGDTNRSGLLHISNISQGRITSVSDVLAVDDKVKALVVKSMFPDKISLSIAELESEPGLFLSNKEKVFSEAKKMAKKYRQKISSISTTRKPEALPTDGLPFEDEERLYSNWKWFKFERDSETSP
ncbi:uncharacterized protein LOC105178804 isoform X3 [Sesamum indicum]|uniref:Uncharacterized protein LOC105178804 isoform X3 n=1 Tax=Sesamum indicum TaxID=4182 RepID=A0A8M8UV54_SESIN|nr:uncharacterized protein LOC105178804 isoform X3 [Sesamum indicum]